jgi:uncharacterized membrane protein
MTESKHAWTDQQVEEILGNLLRSGVILAAVFVLMGGVLYLIHYGAALPDYRVFHGEPTDLRSVSGIVQDVLDLRRRGTIQFGLLLLIATPIARVVFSVFAFLRQRDRVYVFITLFVLAVLLYSLIGEHP